MSWLASHRFNVLGSKVQRTSKAAVLAAIYAFLFGFVLFMSGCGGSPSGGGVSPSPPPPPPSQPPPGSEFLYQFSFASAIQVSELNTSTGVLAAPIEATPYVDFEDGGLPVLVTPSGKFMYEEGFYQSPPLGSGFSGPASVIWGFAIGGASATLTNVPNTPVPKGTGLGFTPNGMAMDPEGKFVFCSVYNGTNSSGQSQNSILTFAIDQSTGALTQSSSLSSTSQAWLIAQTVDPSNRYLYAASGSPNGYAVTVYSIAPSNGALTEIAGSPFFVLNPPEGIQYSMGVAVDAAGKFVYVTLLNFDGYGSPGIYSFSVDPASNALMTVAGSPFPVGAPGATGFDFTNNFLYATYPGLEAISSYDVSAGTVGSTSSTPIPSSYYGKVLVDPDAQFVVVNDSFDTASTFKINPTTGALGLVTGSPFSVGSQWSSAVIAKIPK